MNSRRRKEEEKARVRKRGDEKTLMLSLKVQDTGPTILRLWRCQHHHLYGERSTRRMRDKRRNKDQEKNEREMITDKRKRRRGKGTSEEEG